MRKIVVLLGAGFSSEEKNRLGGILPEEHYCVRTWESRSKAETNILLTKNESEAIVAKKEGIPAIAIKNEGNMPWGTSLLLENLEDLTEKDIEKQICRSEGLPWSPFCTERCRITELCEADLPALFENQEFRDILQEAPEEKEDFFTYFKTYLKNMYELFDYGIWKIEEKTNGKHLGYLALYHSDEGKERRLYLGYLISPDMRRRGFAKECCLGAINYAKDLGFSVIYIEMENENRVSEKMALSLGFVPSNGIKTDRKYFQINKNLI